MVIDYTVVADRTLLIARASAPVTGRALDEHFHAVAADDSLDRGARALLDLTGASCPITVPELYDVVGALRAMAATVHRLAIVCDDRAVMPRLLLLQEFAKAVPVEIGAFLDARSAAAWLDVRGDALDAAES